jgi:hypothetical protein
MGCSPHYSLDLARGFKLYHYQEVESLRGQLLNGVMRIALVILLLVVVVFLGFFFFGRSPAPPQWSPNTRLVFLGFTNMVPMAPATNAFFIVTNVPREHATWHVREISRKEGKRWKAWEPLPLKAFVFHRSSNPSLYDVYALIPVQTTTAPSRIIVELRRGDVLKSLSWWQKVRLKWVRFTHGDVVRAMNPGAPTYFMTNEISVAVP